MGRLVSRGKWVRKHMGHTDLHEIPEHLRFIRVLDSIFLSLEAADLTKRFHQMKFCTLTLYPRGYSRDDPVKVGPD
jgi:hypothetical protein